MKNSTHRLVLIALYVTLALILSWIESLIPLPLPIPGAKIGLPNCVTLLSLLTLGGLPTLCIVIARIFLSGFLFSGLSTILYSLAGGLLSLGVMALLLRFFKTHLSLSIISILGAVTHNLGQLVVAALVVQNLNLLLYYFPFLVLLAIPTGFFIGTITRLLLGYLQKTPYFKK